MTALLSDDRRHKGSNRVYDGARSPLNEVGDILLRRRWQILLTFSFIVAAVTFVTLRTPKQYESRMKILVKNERADIVVSASSNDQSSPPGEVSETKINTEIELLNNNDLLTQVVVASGLDRPSAARGGAKERDKQLALEGAVTNLQHSLKITPVHKTDIIQVEYTSSEPQRAVAVLRQLAASYLEAHLRVHGTPGTHAFFLSQLEHYRTELKNAETRVSEFCRANNIVLFGPQQESLLKSESDSSSMLLATDTSIREYARKIADARTQLGTTLPRVTTQSRTLSNQNSVERLGTMLVELQNRRTQLLSKFQPDDRMVQEVSDEIANTQAGLERANNLKGFDQTTDVNPVRQTLELDLTRDQAELAGFEARRQSLARQTDSYHAQLEKLGRSTEEYNDLIRQQKEAEENYVLYARKTEEARITDSLDQQKIANVAIAENPVEPQRPSKPNVGLNLELGTIAAALLSLGLAFSLEYLSRPFPRVEIDPRVSLDQGSRIQSSFETFNEARELESFTGLPVLATTIRS